MFVMLLVKEAEEAHPSRFGWAS